MIKVETISLCASTTPLSRKKWVRKIDRKRLALLKINSLPREVEEGWIGGEFEVVKGKSRAEI